MTLAALLSVLVKPLPVGPRPKPGDPVVVVPGTIVEGVPPVGVPPMVGGPPVVGVVPVLGVVPVGGVVDGLVLALLHKVKKNIYNFH